MKKFLIALAGITALALLFHDPILGAVGSYLVQNDSPVKADVVLVLAGDNNGDRIRLAGDLVRQGFAPKALVSGPGGLYGQHECDLAIAYAIKAGYPESYFIHGENDAHSTEEEARAMVPYLERQHAQHVLLVTSDFHTRRAARTFRAAVPRVRFTVVAAGGGEFSADGWWHNRQGRKIAFLEWTKTVASWLGI